MKSASFNHGLGMLLLAGLAGIASCVEGKKEETRPLLAVFLANKTTINAEDTVLFEDFTDHSPDAWFWTFEGGEPQFTNSKNPAIRYRTAGTYDVTLTVSRGTGTGKTSNTQTKHGYIQVGPPSSACGASIVLTNEGNQLHVVRIGSQCWLKENMNTLKFRDGSDIPFVNDSAAWAAMQVNQTKTPAACYGNLNGSNTASYGFLYNWYTATDPRGVCPVGWHVPSDADWTILTDYLGGILVAGTKMKSTQHWTNGGVGTNSSGFDAIPIGPREKRGGWDYPFGQRAEYWATTEENGGADAYALYLGREGVATHDITKKDFGFSIRCVKD